MQEVKAVPGEGKPARVVDVPDDQLMTFKTMKVFDIQASSVLPMHGRRCGRGNEWTAQVAEMAAAQGAGYVIICASIESEIAH